MTRRAAGLLALALLAAAPVPARAAPLAPPVSLAPPDDDLGQPYARENCPDRLAPVANGVSCRFVGDDGYGALVYRLYFGAKPHFLFEFTRSVAVLVGPMASRLAVNDFQGSTEADCYVYPDANHPRRRLSVARAWAGVRQRLPLQYARTVDRSDHTYFTCRGWAGGRVRVEASYRYSGAVRAEGAGPAVDGSLLTATGWLSMDGRLGGIVYRPG